MANKIKLAGTTSNTFQVGLQGATFSSSNISTPYTLVLPEDTGADGQVLSTDGTGNLSWIDSGGSGTSIVNGTSNVDIASANANVTVSVNSTSNVAVFANTGVTINGVLSATGNITGSYIFGNGSQLTGVVSSYGNGNVTTLLADLGSNAISTTGNVTAGYLSGNISLATGTVANAAYADNAGIASVAYSVDLANVVNAGNIASINLNGNGSQVLSGNGSWTTPVGYGNSNVSTYLDSGDLTSNIVTTGDVSATNGAFSANVTILGNLSVTGNINYNNIEVSTTDNLIWQAANAASTASMANAGGIAVGPAGSSYATWLFNSTQNRWTSSLGINVANVYTSGIVSATGTITGGNLITSGLISTTGAVVASYVTTTGNIGAAGTIDGTDITSHTTISAPGNVTGGNILTAGIVSATGNITGGNLITAGSIQVAGNLLSTGNLTSNLGSSTTRWNNVWAGNVVAGDITSTGYIWGNGAGITGVSAISVETYYANVNVSPESIVIRDANGNIYGNSFSATGDIDVTGNVTGGNLYTSGNVLATSNIEGFDLIANGSVDAIGNITGGNVNTTGLITATGNITGGNVNTAGLITATGNITGGNVNTAGTVSATGSVTLAVSSAGNVVINRGTVNAIVVAGDRFAIGNSAATSQVANSIVLNATNTGITASLSGTYISPLRVETTQANITAASSGNIVAYNSTTKEITAISIPGFAVTSTANTTISTINTFTTVSWNSESLDSNSWFASNRFTPQRAGWYQITGGARCAVNGTGTTYENGVVLRKNGSEWAAISDGFGYIRGAVSAMIYFNGSTDYIECGIFAGTTGSVSQVSSVDAPQFSGYWIRS